MSLFLLILHIPTFFRMFPLFFPSLFRHRSPPTCSQPLSTQLTRRKPKRITSSEKNMFLLEKLSPLQKNIPPSQTKKNCCFVPFAIQCKCQQSQLKRKVEASWIFPTRMTIRYEKYRIKNTSWWTSCEILLYPARIYSAFIRLDTPCGWTEWMAREWREVR